MQDIKVLAANGSYERMKAGRRPGHRKPTGGQGPTTVMDLSV